jgi:riboflavin synthase
MFTGLIQEVGTVRGVAPRGEAVDLQLWAPQLAPQLAAGDSLAVNGVCLTITAPGEELVVATAIPETLSRTNLGALAAGSRVNLEPALRVGDRLGGHMVQGHVDGVGRVVALTRRGISLEVTIAAPPAVLRYTVEKGSVALDGVSLTVARVTEGDLTVALIPHTLGATTLEERRVGDSLNLEVDILAKYVERLLGRLTGEEDTGLTEAFLREHGFT